jgi:3-oxoadipate enol-lactonase
VTRHSVTIADGSIGWHDDGPADAVGVVLLHSLGADHSMWRPQTARLVERHRVIRADTRGHGTSSAPRGPYTLDVLAADVMAVVDAAGLDRFHLVGLSLGGQTALRIALDHPGRLLSVTASNTAAKLGDADAWNARIQAIRTGGMESIREAVLARWFTPAFAANHPGWFEEANRVFAATDPEGYVGCCTALATADLRSEVGSIGVRTLVVGATDDQSTPPHQAEWLHLHIPGSEIEIIPAAAHLSNLDQPEAFTDRLLRFLGAVDAN